VLPAEPGQHASAPVPAMHGCALQHMSAAFTVQVPGWPPVAPGVPEQSAVFVWHWPVPVLQTSPAGHCESSVHLPHTFGPPAPQMPPLGFALQSLFWQQLPAMQLQFAPPQSVAPPAPQQKSAGLLQVAPAVAHVAATQAPVVVSQIVLGPYVGSDWHWESVVHLPQKCGVVSPQISPAFAPVQSASVLQLPGTQLPAVSQTHDGFPEEPYAVVQLPLSAGLLHGKHWVLTQSPAGTPVVVHAVSVPVHSGAAESWPESVVDESCPESVGEAESWPESAGSEESSPESTGALES
jgi:hypothetical protein